MIEQTGRIIDRSGARASVEVIRQAVCGGCRQEGTGCGTSALGEWLLQRRRPFDIENRIDAQIGDEVIIGVSEQVLQRMALTVFLLPLLCMLFAAMIGSAVGGAIDADAAEPVSVVAGLGGLFAGIRFARLVVNRWFQNGSSEPVLLRRAIAPAAVLQRGIVRT